MKMFKWQTGRQNSGYDKMLLALSNRFKFDFYLLRIPDEMSVPLHCDPCPEGYEHRRINLALCASKPPETRIYGGPKALSMLGGRLVFFRPDVSPHSLERRSTVVQGRATYMLSFGWLKRVKTV